MLNITEDGERTLIGKLVNSNFLLVRWHADQSKPTWIEKPSWCIFFKIKLCAQIYH